MPPPHDVHILEIRTSRVTSDYRTPMKFGGRVVVDATLLNVHVTVETGDGRQGEGLGSMPMGNAWAWPSGKVEGEQTLEAMSALAERIAARAGQLDSVGHPLELTHDLAPVYATLADEVVSERGLPEPFPALAILVAASPWEAAIHDAYGKAHQENSYNLLGREFVNRDLGHFLGESFAGEYLDQYTTRTPKDRMPLYHLVGALDPLTEADLKARLNDGLPETLAEWIVADGLTHLKIKLAGDDLDWDVQRVADIDRVVAEVQQARRCAHWFYSLDFNEKCQDVQYVLDFLHRLREVSSDAWNRVQYIEQPTHRDLRANPDNRMHEAAKIKPVVIDESLVDFASLLLAREQGYSGVALKACKGHTEALLMGAAAQKHQLFLCVQDLTCVGASFLHSATLAARIPTIAAIEGNGRQYCPAGNAGWADRFPSMFEIEDGTVGTGVLTGPGLGY